MRARTVLGALWLVASTASCAAETTSPEVPRPSSTVYRDPATGKFVPPPAAARAAAPAARLSTSTANLAEVVGPRGGRMVRLDGRFMNHLQAIRGDAGVAAACTAEPR